MLSNHDAGGLSDQIAEIIDDLEEAAAGVARQLMETEDVEGLSPRQRAVYDLHILPALRALANSKAAQHRDWQLDSIKD